MRKSKDFLHCLLVFYLVYFFNGAPLVSGVKFRDVPQNYHVEFGSRVGTFVAMVTASAKNDTPVVYRLFNTTDAAYFAMDSNSGNITTKKIIDKKVNGTFQLILEARSGRNEDKKRIAIQVTQPENRFDPQFLQESYIAKLDLDTPIGGTILRVQAADNDTTSAVRYSIEAIPGVSDTSVASFQIDALNGSITLREPVKIGAKNVTFYVVARDTGIPPRESRVTATIAVSYISEPRNVTVNAVLSNVATICWREPETGEPDDFRLRYHEVGTSNETLEIFEQVFTKIDSTESPREVEVTTVTITTTNPTEEASAAAMLCGNITDLKAATTYNVQVFGQKGTDLGRSSAILTFTTAKNRCAAVDCHDGSCVESEEGPGYVCICNEGFLGNHCERKNPCFENPCQNEGLCHVDNGTEYTCTCRKGFKGTHCSIFDPCDAETNPCLNDGLCKTKDPNDYECECQPGFYSKSCELFNPCVLSPCQNQGTCSNISSGEYTCTCSSGFTGRNCTEEINECLPDPCGNGATCVDGIGNYSCSCSAGFTGRNCTEEINECLPDPCGNGATCIDGIGNYSCSCSAGFTGRNCTEEINECLPDPCVNGGTCVDGIGNYSCVCAAGFTGRNCELDVDECLSTPCSNNAVCENGLNTFTCHCRPGYYGELCEFDRDECVPNPCLNGGTCTDKVNDFHCQCQPGFKGPLCQIHEHCLEDTTATSKGQFQWPATPHGETAQLLCPFGADSSASAAAKQRPSLSVWFDDPADKKSVKKRSAQQIRNPSRRHGLQKDAEFRKQMGGGSFRDFRRLEQEKKMKLGPNGTVYAVRSCEVLPNGTLTWLSIDDTFCKDERTAESEKVSSNLECLVDSWTDMKADQVVRAAEQIQNLVQFAVKNPVVAQSMMNTLSKILDVEDSVLSSADTGDQLLSVIDRFTQNVELKPEQTIVLSTPNIAIETSLLKADIQKQTFSFTPKFGPKRSRRTSEDPWNETLENLISINIPKEAVELALKQNGLVRLQIVSFRNGKLFRPATENAAGKPGLVVAATVGNSSISGLTNPVTYSVPFNEGSTFYSCVYWDENAKEWSGKGIKTNITSEGVMCSSDHLTAFSVLLDPTPQAPISDVHRKILSIISYVGSGCSVLGLFITVFMYSLFRNLRRDRGGKILLNLCISLLLLNVAYLLSAAAGTEKPGPESSKPFFSPTDGRVWVPGLPGLSPQSDGYLCIATGVAIHYLVLTSLGWMLMEANNMYQLLITVFARSESCFMVKRMAAAWGIPLIVVAATAQINIDFYNDPSIEYCRLSPGYPIVYYVTFVGPVCLMLFLNCFVFAMVMRVILLQGRRGKAVGKVDPAGPPRFVTAAQVRGAITVMALLGISWIFGALAFGRARLVMQYLFCITSSFQGFVIFIVRVVQFPEARLACLNFLRTGKIKTRYEGTRNSSGPTTHSSTGTHFQARSTLSSSIHSASHSKKALNSSSSTQPSTSSSNGTTQFNISDAPTLPADARGWFSESEESTISPAEPKLRNEKEQGSFKKNFRRIFGQFRLEPSSILKSRELMKNRSLGPHALLERHVSGATNPPPSPGEKPHRMTNESLVDVEDLAKPNFAIGEEITLLGNSEKIGYYPGDQQHDELKAQESLISLQIESAAPPVAKRLSGISSLTADNASRRSSVAKEGSNTSWTFLRPDGSPGSADCDLNHLGAATTTTTGRPRCSSIPVLSTEDPAGSKVHRRSTSAHQLLPRVHAKPEKKKAANRMKKNSCPASVSCNDLLKSNENSILEKKSVSLSESDIASTRENSFVMIAGRRVTVSRTPSKAELENHN